MSLLATIMVLATTQGHAQPNVVVPPPNPMRAVTQWFPGDWTATVSPSSLIVNVKSNTLFSYSGTITDTDIFRYVDTPETNPELIVLGNLDHGWQVVQFQSGSLYSIPNSGGQNPTIVPSGTSTKTTTWKIVSKVVAARSYADDVLRPIDGSLVRPPNAHYDWDGDKDVQTITVVIEPE